MGNNIPEIDPNKQHRDDEIVGVWAPKVRKITGVQAPKAHLNAGLYVSSVQFDYNPVVNKPTIT